MLMNKLEEDMVFGIQRQSGDSVAHNTTGINLTFPRHCVQVESAQTHTECVVADLCHLPLYYTAVPHTPHHNLMRR